MKKRKSSKETKCGNTKLKKKKGSTAPEHTTANIGEQGAKKNRT